MASQFNRFQEVSIPDYNRCPFVSNSAVPELIQILHSKYATLVFWPGSIRTEDIICMNLIDVLVMSSKPPAFKQTTTHVALPEQSLKNEKE